jgi:hypothetical protein
MPHNGKNEKPVVLSEQYPSIPPPPNIINRVLDGLQRLTFLVLAAWHLYQTGDVLGSLVILAAGFIDARTAKAVLTRFLQFPREDNG